MRRYAPTMIETPAEHEDDGDNDGDDQLPDELADVEPATDVPPDEIDEPDPNLEGGTA